MKIYLTLSFNLLFISLLLGQETTNYIPNTNVVPPSLENYFFTKNGNLDISGNDGAFSHRIPIFELNAGDIALDLNLTYFSDGVKVNDIAGLVGMSWNLNVGGMITRVVRGLPDEDLGNTIFRPLKANLYYSLTGNYTDQEFVSNHLNTYINMYSANGVSNSPNNIDTQQDEFSFNFNGYSGTFYLDQGKIYIISNNDVKATYSKKQSTSGSQYLEFIFTTPDGIKYVFGGEEAFVETSNIMDCVKSYERPPHSTWHLKQISDVKNNTMDFKYVTQSKSYPMDYSEFYSITRGVDNYPGGSVIDSYSKMCTVYFQAHDAKYLKEIIYRNGKVVFTYESRRDYSTGYRLSSLNIFNANNQVVLPVSFQYTYSGPMTGTNGSLTNRSFLAGLNLSDRVYKFDYNNINGLPDRLSFKLDKYGYTNSNSVSSLTNFYIDSKNPAPEFISRFGDKRADRSVDDVKSLYGVLTKITYPSKGYTSIVYENNKSEVTEEVSTISGDRITVEKQNCEPYGSIPSTLTHEFVSNGKEMKFVSSMDVTRCPGVNVDDLHDVYSISVRDVTDNKIIFSAAGRYDVFVRTLENGEISNNKTVFDPIKTVKAHKYLLTFNVNSRFNNVYATIDFTYNEEKTTVNREVNYSGARVREIKDYDGTLSENVKKYYYNSLPTKDNKRTSLQYSYIERYKKCVPTAILTSTGSSEISSFNCQTVNFSTSNYHDMFNQRDKRIRYEYVLKEVDNGFVEQIFDVGGISDDSQLLLPNPLSTILRSNNNWRQNLLLGTKYFKSQFDTTSLVKTETNEYSAIKTERFDNYNIEPGIVPVMSDPLSYTSSKYIMAGGQCISLYCNVQGKVAVNHYYNYIHQTKLVNKISTDYTDGGSHVITETKYAYNGKNHLQPSQITLTNSKVAVLTTEYLYPPDLLGVEQTALMQKLNNANRILEPVVVRLKYGSGLLDEKHIQYKDFNGMVTKAAIHQKKGGNVNLSTDVDRVVKYDNYDTNGNPLDYSILKNTPISIVWGYGGQYPIAEIKNATYADVETVLSKATIDALNLPTVTEATIITAMNKLRTDSRLAKSMVTSYTYKPLVGMTSKTDARGVTEYYEYDGMQRLKAVLDQVKNVTTSMDYHYRTN